MIFHRLVSNILICLVLTVLIEAAFSFILGVRTGYGQLVILLTNTITNPILNCILMVVVFYVSRSTYYFFLVPLEALIVAVEGIIYKKTLNLNMNCFIFSFLLNAASFFVGNGIVKIIEILGGSL